MTTPALDLDNLVQYDEIPENAAGRPSAPNPFDGRFPTPEGKAMVLVLPSSTDAERKEIDRLISLAQKAARNAKSDDAPNGYTCRSKREEAPKVKGKAMTRVSLWSRDRIVHKSKSGQTATAKTNDEASDDAVS